MPLSLGTSDATMYDGAETITLTSYDGLTTVTVAGAVGLEVERKQIPADDGFYHFTGRTWVLPVVNLAGVVPREQWQITQGNGTKWRLVMDAELEDLGAMYVVVTRQER